MTVHTSLPRPAIEHLQGHYAGLISRMLAWMVDALIIAVVITVTGWISWVTLSTLSSGALFGLSADMLPGLRSVIEFLRGPHLASFLTLLFIVGYHVFFISFVGMTPGKALFGVRVVTTQGRRISPIRSLVRYLCYFVSAIPLFLGFIWILVDDQRQGWHDKIAGTVVIYTWEARPDERFLLQEIQEIARGRTAPSNEAADRRGD